jgi:Tfp pilus assembly protein PilF
LNIDKLILGGNHICLADTYNNLGVVYMKKGDYDLAIEYYQSSLKIKR